VKYILQKKTLKNKKQYTPSFNKRQRNLSKNIDSSFLLYQFR